MRKRTMASFMLLFAFSIAPRVAHAGIVFSDNFNGENGGLTQNNYTGFANFNVTGNVDIVRSGDFGVTAAGGSGSAVDLAGTPGPGQISSKAAFAFNAGDTVRLLFDLSGNQRDSGASDSWTAVFNLSSGISFTNYGFNLSGSDTSLGSVPSTTFFSLNTSVAGNAPYATRSIFFTAGAASSLTFNIGTFNSGTTGPMLDNVRLDITPAATPEPASMALLCMGGGLLAVGRKFRQRKTEIAA